MAITYDTTTGIGSGTGITGTQSWTHTAAASLVGGVGVVIVGGGVEETSGVTYGGWTMTRIATGSNTGGESGTTSCWWIANDDPGWPGSGSRTVQVTRSGSTAYIAQAFSVLTASGYSADVLSPTQNIGWDIGNSLSISNINTSLTIPNGVSVFLYGGLYSGENALSSITDDASLTRANSADFGNFVGVINRRTAIYTGTGAALTTFAWTQSSDDGAWAVVAISENAAATTYTFTDKKADAIVRRPTTVSDKTANAVLKATVTSAVTKVDAIKRWNVSQSAIVDALVRKIGSGQFAADAVRKATISGQASANAVARRSFSSSVLADALTKLVGSGQLTADAIRFDTIDEQALLDAILRETQAASLALDAVLFKTMPFGFTAEAEIPGAALTITDAFTADSETTYVDRCIWTFPSDGDAVEPMPELRFLMPTGRSELYFWLELDRVGTFDSADLRQYLSTSSQTGWSYWDGDSWEPIAGTGVPNSYAGNEAQFIVPIPLTGGTWYRRVRAGTR